MTKEQKHMNWQQIAKQGYDMAKKFVDKIESGRGRSVETYNEAKAFIAAYEAALEKESK